jgi:Fur family ferric uptake transcriptional regulator
VNIDISRLQQAGLKVTTARSLVLTLFRDTARRHLSAEEIYHILVESGEDVSVATIYRVLTQFETAGIVKRLHLIEKYSVFELNEGTHHDHIVCIKCGHVDEFMDKIIEDRQKSVAVNKGYKITDHQHIIYGICTACQKIKIRK